MYYQNKQNKTVITLLAATAAMMASTTFSLADDIFMVKSLDLAGNDRNLCITRDKNNYELKKCDGGKRQEFRIKEGSSTTFLMKRDGRCLTAIAGDDIEAARDDIRDIVKIKANDCSGSFDEVFAKNAPKNNFVAWYLDKGNRLRALESHGALDVCLSDAKKGNKVRAQDCSNTAKVGRWKLEKVS